MKISIVIPIKNAEKYLEETLQSIVNQSGGFETEILVEDGISSDNSLEIIRKTSENLPNGVGLSVNSQEDKNLYEAVARGLKKASGEIVTWISGTDFYLPNAFSTVVDVFSNNKTVDWITGIPMVFNEQGQNVYSKLPVWYSKNLIKAGMYDGSFLHFIQQESVFMRKSLIDKVDLDEMANYPAAGDQKLWNMLSDYAKLYIVDSHLGGSRLHADRVSKEGDYENEFKQIASIKGFGAYVEGSFQYLLTYLAPEKVKRLFSTSLIRYRNGSWKK